MRDFAPIKEQISLHGLGFMQIVLQGNYRLHIWHPSLPRRECFDLSAIHNHRFSFRSTVLVGTQVNQRFNVIEHQDDIGEYVRISHDGARTGFGNRESFVEGSADISPMPIECYEVGQSYEMPIGQYHETPNHGVVVTLMEKLSITEVHASSLLKRGGRYDQNFDRFAIPAFKLWQLAGEAVGVL
jgi:hypothetical protein